MAQAYSYSPEEIQQREREFSQANHRDHVRFLVLSIGLTLAVVLGVLWALAD